MKTQVAFHRLFIRLRSLSLHVRYLRLGLSDSSAPIQEQVETLLQTHQKLHLLESNLHSIREIVVLHGRNRHHSSDWSYLVLIKLIEQLQKLIFSLMHLTEEYFVDPVGVQSCLESAIDVDILKLQHYFATLSSTKLISTSSRASSNSAA